MDTTEKFKAFTLAEVLITLVIVGVIAALTIPTVMKKYKRHVTETRLKTAYSTITNAFNASIKDHGSINFGDYLTSSNPCVKIMEKYIIPYVNYTNYVKKTLEEHGYTDGILKPDGSVFYKNTSKVSMVTLANGMTLLSTGNAVTKQSGDKIYCLVFIYVDLNGKKKPNVLGKDVFIITQYLFKNAMTTMLGECKTNWYCLYTSSTYNLDADPKNYKSTYGVIYDERTGQAIFTGARYPEGELRDKCYSATEAQYCGGLIRQNGWKIPDDYPWL